MSGIIDTDKDIGYQSVEYPEFRVLYASIGDFLYMEIPKHWDQKFSVETPSLVEIQKIQAT